MMPIRTLILFVTLVLLTVAAFVIAFKTAKPAHARDLGQWAQASPEQRQFFNGLKDAGGVPCCDDHDGFDVKKSEARGSELWVEIEGQGWLPVPNSSLLRKRNPYGSARAWIGLSDGKKFVRCFIDGYGG